jgi:hypothetical protein
VLSRSLLFWVVVLAACGRVGFQDAQREHVTDAAAADVSAPDAGAGSSPRAACCTAWCQDDNRFGPGEELPSEAYYASDYTMTPVCSSSTGCTCTVAAWIANTWTIVTGDVCDAHNFATSCPSGGCDGTQCPVIAIEGRWDAATDSCTCVGRALTGGLTQDIWSSTCEENDNNRSFLEACPAT